MHTQHRLAPDFGRKAAARHALERRVVVVAHPDARHVIGGKAQEPRIARRLRGAGLARRLAPRQLCPPSGAVFDHPAHHVGQFARRTFADDPLSDPALTAHQRGVLAHQPQLGQAVGGHRRAAVEDAGIGAGHLDQCAFRGSERQRGPVGQIALDAEVAGHLAHQIAPDAFGNLHRRNVERLRQRLREIHPALEIAGIVLGAPTARAGDIQTIRFVYHLRIIAEAQFQRGRIHKGLEGRAGLPPRLRGTVEGPDDLGRAAADHGAHGAIGVHHHDRRLCLGAFAYLFVENHAQRLFRRVLKPLIKRCADHHILGRVAGQEFRPRGHHPIGEIPARAPLCRF